APRRIRTGRAPSFSAPTAKRHRRILPCVGSCRFSSAAGGSRRLGDVDEAYILADALDGVDRLAVLSVERDGQRLAAGDINAPDVVAAAARRAPRAAEKFVLAPRRAGVLVNEPGSVDRLLAGLAPAGQIGGVGPYVPRI